MDCNIRLLFLKYFGQAVDDVCSHFLLGFQRVGGGTFLIDDGDFIRIDPETGSLVVQRVEHDEVEVLAFKLAFGVGCFVVGLEGKSHQYLIVFLRGTQRCSYVLRWLEAKHQIVLFAFDFRIGHFFRGKVGHGSTENARIGILIGFAGHFPHPLCRC